MAGMSQAKHTQATVESKKERGFTRKIKTKN
jgi:hypothetical protein